MFCFQFGEVLGKSLSSPVMLLRKQNDTEVRIFEEDFNNLIEDEKESFQL